MLSIEKLNVSVGDKKILKDFNLKISKGEVHAIMGPNGSGKSTLSYVLAGKSGYEVDGKILFKSGSSATLAGSGMAFKSDLYSSFLKQNKVSGAGFDKVLQAWLLNQNLRIAFNEKAVVYDEKTSHSDQLVKQRPKSWRKLRSAAFDF